MTSTTEIRYLVSGDAGAWLVGPPVWTMVNGAWLGRVAAWADNFEEGAVKFVLNIATTPNRPTFVLVVRNEHFRRLDVNQPHRDLPDTHWQGRDDPAHTEWAEDARGWVPTIPKTGRITGAHYEAAFLAFAAKCGVGLGTFEWLDPPERGPR